MPVGVDLDAALVEVGVEAVLLENAEHVVEQRVTRSDVGGGAVPDRDPRDGGRGQGAGEAERTRGRRAQERPDVASHHGRERTQSGRSASIERSRYCPAGG